MTTLLQVSINFSHFNSLRDDSSRKHNCCVLKLSAPNCCYTLSGTNIGSLHQRKFKPGGYRGRWSFLGLSSCKDEFWVAEQGWKRKKSLVVVRFNQGFRFNDGSGGGGGGGGGRDNGKTLRLLGNLAFAIGLTYLSVTGQLGWVLDTIVSIWLLAVLLPIVGLGAFIWWAGRDIVQGSCPNCGNDFQIFKSFLNDDLQLCPFCSQPFSVVGNEFVRDPVKFSNESATFGQAFHRVSRGSKKGKDSPQAVVDVEAEIKDVD
ncbi:uncharacterized protein LOC132308520 isoform X1 [Cornus florida]|uniref:uncharacterized protein LOC132308520 isoform X1 n=1 Tax=Cornus florida TaxID=4283 RepID=UPI002896B79C|nr:uncharacterized protein LOC132308520 isoform X1 [Cornus florida]XP_059662603.1 uncharacterized protein LOC132308520 isoform X1 [Cornus florida]